MRNADHKRCRLCKEQTLAPFTCADKKLHHYCYNCLLIFADHRYVIDHREEKARYEEHDNNLQNEGYVRMFKDFIQVAIQPYAQAGAKTLDFGCGPGPVLQTLLQDRGFPTNIYDPYFAPHQMSLDQQYDLITCTEVFEHLLTPAVELQLLTRMLKPGGILAIMTHMHRGPEAFCTWWYRQDITHITFFTTQTFHWVTENYPLELLFCDGVKTIVLRKTPD